MNTAPACDNESGFTLIETLIAFLVLSLSLAVLTKSIFQASTQIRSADLIAEATALGQKVLVEARSSDGQLGSQGEAGALSWRWTKAQHARSDSRGALLPVVLTTVQVARKDSTTPLFTLQAIDLEAAE